MLDKFTRVVLFLAFSTALFGQVITPPSGGGGGGGTIPNTTNLIKGDGVGNGADSGLVPANVVLSVAPSLGIAHFPGASQTATSSLIVTGDITNAAVTAAKMVNAGVLTGDVSGTFPATTVSALNGTSLAGLATGILKNTTGTGVPSIAGSADILAACPTCVTSAAVLTNNALMTGAGSQGSKTPAATATMDASGNISTPGTVTSGSGSGVAGADSFLQGTLPGSFPTNSATIYAPTSIPTAYQILLPTAGSTGFWLSTFSGTLETLSHVASTGSGNVCLVTGCGYVGGAANLTSVGSIPYVSASGIVTQDGTNPFFYDNTNHRVGIGTNTPSWTLHIKNVSDTSAFPLIVSNNAGTTIFGVSSTGAISTSGTGGGFTCSAASCIFLGGATSATQVRYYEDQANTKGYWDTGTAGINWLNQNRVTGNIPVVIQAIAAQTADLIQWQGSGAAGAGAVLAKIDIKGQGQLTGLTSIGTKFTITGCSAGTTVGGATAGQFASGTTGTCTVVITMNGATGLTAPNGWSCVADDITTPGNLISQSATSPTTCTVTGTTVSGDTITFHAEAY